MARRHTAPRRPYWVAMATDNEGYTFEWCIRSSQSPDWVMQLHPEFNNWWIFPAMTRGEYIRRQQCQQH